MFVSRKVVSGKLFSKLSCVCLSLGKLVNGKHFPVKGKFGLVFRKVFSFSCVCFPKSGFREITFQTFLCLFVIRKVGQRKTLSSKRKIWLGDTTKSLMSSPKCRSVEVINNPARPGLNHREVNCINYK